MIKFIRKEIEFKFRGKKDNASKHIISYIQSVINKNPTKKIVVFDVFGGSCYISHLIKTTFKDIHVICNDFDNINEIYEVGYHTFINKCLSDIKTYLDDKGYKKQ